MESTSTSLLRRLRQPGDRQAWGRFVELYTPLIYHWGRRSGLSADDAADLTQDVLVLLVRKLPEFHYDRGKSFRGWLRTLTLNKWREQRRRRGVPAVNVTQSALAKVAEPDPAAEYWETEFRQHLVERALRLLEGEFSPATWRACRQYLIEGRPAADVAAELGLSVWTIYAAKSRLLRRLREELEGMLD
jgi:RNA polymerase sigma-70 factor (ECF subfamily)